MHIIDRNEFPVNINFAIAELQRSNFWKVIEQKRDYAIFRARRSYIVMIIRDRNYFLESFKTIDDAMPFIYGMLI